MIGPAMAEPVTESQRAAVTAAVNPYLADPYSAVFGEMHAAKGTEGLIVCGAVNAKNRFGAYKGNAVFLVTAKEDFSNVSVGQIGESLLASVPVLSRCLDAGIVFSDEIRLPIAKAMIGQ